MTIRPDTHERFARICARARAKEQAEWEQIVRGSPKLNRAWGGVGQAARGSRLGKTKRRKGVPVHLDSLQRRSTGSVTEWEEWPSP